MSRCSALRTALIGVPARLSALPACASPCPRRTADAIDLPRFMGTWHVIAHVPYFGERGHVASRDEYTLRDTDEGRRALRLPAKVSASPSQDRCEARGPRSRPSTGNRRWTTAGSSACIPAKFRILEVAPGLLMGADRLSRPRPGLDHAPAMPLIGRRAIRRADEEDARARRRRRQAGQRVPQVPAQVGKPGFGGAERAVERSAAGRARAPSVAMKSEGRAVASCEQSRLPYSIACLSAIRDPFLRSRDSRRSHNPASCRETISSRSCSAPAPAATWPARAAPAAR